MGMTFTEQLQSKGAREFQIAALSADEPRALAAIEEAERRGVNSVIPYALTLYDDPSWAPTGAKSRVVTNAHADVRCPVCEGVRMVPVGAGSGLYEETYAPCAICNADANTEFWTPDGRRLVSIPR
jgi:hypothetical protein